MEYKPTKKSQPTPAKRSFYKRFPILTHLFIMALLSALILFAIFFFLDRYTRHGATVTVPAVVGLSLNEANESIEAVNLSCEVVDSIYTLDRTPGSILEVVPHEGSLVKPHRTVYLTIVAKEKPQQVIPEVTNMSMRQAKATLEGLGFRTILVKYIPGEFDNLTQMVCNKQGKAFAAGERVSLDEELIIVVSSNNVDHPDVSLDEELQWLLAPDSLDYRQPKEKETEQQPIEEEPLSEEESWW